jgi:hypothetical protein
MRTLRILSVIAIFAMLSTMVFAAPPLPPTPWSAIGSIHIPVVMDIVPVASLRLNGAIIKLYPTEGGDVGDYSGCASPMPVLQSNIPVEVWATVEPVAPDVTSHDNCWVVIQGDDWGNDWDHLSRADFDPEYTAGGVGINVCVLFRHVNMAMRPEGFNERVGTVTLTVTPD